MRNITLYIRIIFFYVLITMSFDVKAQDIKVFHHTPIRFSPDLYPTVEEEPQDTIRLGNGRIVLRRISFPKFKRDVAIRVNLSLKSAGDPWDKSGSCFVIPKSSLINMIHIARGEQEYPKVDSLVYENLKGVVSGDHYFPTVELMRFMTPFGVGHFSKATEEVNEKRKPVYIDEWADEVNWSADISHLSPLFQEDVYIGVFIDTWTKEGYSVDLSLSFSESSLKCNKKGKKRVLPLLNTVYYQSQSIPDIFSRKSLPVDFELPRKAKNVRLYYIVTGHGGHEGGDEFVRKENILILDGKELYRFFPWRNDCASFRRFNPSTGVWLVKRTVSYITEEGKRGEKEIEEPIGSSDLSRSNWCPGSQVEPIVIPLNGISSGKHRLEISIPEAQAIESNKLNHWLVSAYLVWEE